MIVLLAILQAKEGKEQELEQELRTMVAKTQDEEGALAYVLHAATKTKGKYFFYEKYRDKDALKFHNSTDHMKRFASLLGDLLGEPASIELYEEIDGVKR